MSNRKSKKRTASLCQTSKSPDSSRSKSISTSRVYTSPSGRSPKILQNSVKPSDYLPKSSSTQPPTTYSFPTHFDVLDRLRKFKNFSRILPFTPEIPPVTMPYSKPSMSLVKRMKTRKEKIEFPLPEEGKMDGLLKRIKETERIIRQEVGFMGKIRKFKPKIQLEMTVRKEENVRVKKLRKRKNSTPTKILRSGINARVCYNISS